MQSHHRYFSASASLKAWGLYVTCAGRSRSEPGVDFPSRAHPDEYYFSWERGRVLREWQLVLVEEGRGEVEFRDRRLALAKGALLSLPPDCWHRYRPDRATGWTTRWIGFGGDMAARLMGAAGFCAAGDVRDLSGSRHMRNLFGATVAVVVESGTEQPYTAAARLYAQLAALAERGADDGGERARREDIVRRAQAHLAEHCSEVVDLEALAASLGVPYRTFRHLFTKECGMAPHRFQLEVRLTRAKHLLGFSDLPVAEIAASLGFRSTWYFAHFFQRETGRSATQYRKGSRVPSAASAAR